MLRWNIAKIKTILLAGSFLAEGCFGVCGENLIEIFVPADEEAPLSLTPISVESGALCDRANLWTSFEK